MWRIERATFLVGEDGSVRKVSRKAKIKADTDAVLAIVQALKAFKERPANCPYSISHMADFSPQQACPPSATWKCHPEFSA